MHKEHLLLLMCQLLPTTRRSSLFFSLSCVAADVHQPLCAVGCPPPPPATSGCFICSSPTHMIADPSFTPCHLMSDACHRPPKDHVLQQLAAGKDYLVCEQHKTVQTYGHLAKYLPPGTEAALMLCCCCYYGAQAATLVSPTILPQHNLTIPMAHSSTVT